MALLFSAVRATANDQEVEFFVGGIPREYDDLEGWTAFDRFMGEIDNFQNANPKTITNKATKI